MDWGAYWVLRLRSIFSGTCFFPRWTITDSGIPDFGSSWLGHDEHDVLSDSEFPSPLETDRPKSDCNHLLFRHALDLCSSFGVYFFIFSSPSGTSKPVMESSSSDGSCTIQIYKTDFSIWEGYDGEVYVEWSDRPGEKELIMEIENSYQMQISWYGNERVTVNGQTFFIEDREIRQSTS